MVVRFKKCVLKIDEIRKDEISLGNFLEHEREVIKLISWWKSTEATVQFKTSGSTGTPKVIRVDREKIRYSAAATMQVLDPSANFKAALLCLNPSTIGGAMVVFRSLLRNLDLTVVTPSNNPSKQLDDHDAFDLVSLVPLQMKATSALFWNRFDTILVGGADFQTNDLRTTANIFTTFGMTETVSHFALRASDQEHYKCIGDTIIAQQANGCLKIKGSLTSNQWLQTNDVIDFLSTTTFRWNGRADFIINSGGVKINPESIEKLLSSQFKSSFLVASLPDEKLGNRLILIIEGAEVALDPDYSTLPKYGNPKEIYFLPAFARTSSRKIDRAKTTALLKSRLKL